MKDMEIEGSIYDRVDDDLLSALVSGVLGKNVKADEVWGRVDDLRQKVRQLAHEVWTTRSAARHVTRTVDSGVTHSYESETILDMLREIARPVPDDSRPTDVEMLGQRLNYHLSQTAAPRRKLDTRGAVQAESLRVNAPDASPAVTSLVRDLIDEVDNVRRRVRKAELRLDAHASTIAQHGDALERLDHNLDRLQEDGK